jgi:nucleotide-binding universal stress UspA family protein
MGRMIRNVFRRAPQAGGPGPVRHLLIASEGRRIGDAVIDRAVDMLRVHGGRATVLTVARLWGTSFGLPNPGLRPSKREMDVQKEIMISALDRLHAAGLEAEGHIVTTRNPLKSIRNQVVNCQCDAIVMGADPRRSWFVRAMMWSQEPYRVQASMPVPVHLICPADPPPGPLRGKAKRSRMAAAKS